MTSHLMNGAREEAAYLPLKFWQILYEEGNIAQSSVPLQTPALFYRLHSLSGQMNQNSIILVSYGMHLQQLNEESQTCFLMEKRAY